eukprot:SAG11_NODE_7784_length_1096_cov_2.642929_1_plen_29_part_01
MQATSGSMVGRVPAGMGTTVLSVRFRICI